ncbi:translation initiation factor EIF-2b alpha subunit, putative [Plasmodium relictum]|uniref:Translation initiation factor eIF2B subunit alpha n=1 Tax=Plasmodium relictum TaxID=85471 RepID=A0A1J1HDY1_PLARL|nr:translation initiation factor EIF-2b alpha subunit, putative [Plasmodium relictum]CRH03749.1 translation initiation factor EIF-2b alpha subunit, putative [Plasmodium relictum]
MNYCNMKRDLFEEHEVVRSFKKHYFEEEDEMHIAAIKSIADVIKSNISETNFELFINLNEAKDTLNNFIKNNDAQNHIISMPHSKRMTIYTIVSSCDIYHHFVVKKYTHSENNFINLKNTLAINANEFPKNLEKSLDIIGSTSNIMFTDRKTTILTHSNSKCVKNLLINVIKNQNKQVFVYFTCPENFYNDYSEKDKQFDDMFIKDLRKENIIVTKINLQKVKNIFNTIDFVVIGTELVIDNGGIISKKGIRLLSQLCSLNKKPFYVACEAYKFLKIDKIKYAKDFYEYCTQTVYNENNYLYEYVPHHLITLFYTDIGIFSPSAISFELNKLYINDAFQF